uniref:Uncharacterized protein n=1 Tax=Panagrellus redivivus TaxID=6233 RepID=A0A7E4ZV78_PANRE
MGSFGKVLLNLLPLYVFGASYFNPASPNDLAKNVPIRYDGNDMIMDMAPKKSGLKYDFLLEAKAGQSLELLFTIEGLYNEEVTLINMEFNGLHIIIMCEYIMCKLGQMRVNIVNNKANFKFEFDKNTYTLDTSPYQFPATWKTADFGGVKGLSLTLSWFAYPTQSRLMMRMKKNALMLSTAMQLTTTTTSTTTTKTTTVAAITEAPLHAGEISAIIFIILSIIFGITSFILCIVYVVLRIRRARKMKGGKTLKPLQVQDKKDHKKPSKSSTTSTGTTTKVTREAVDIVPAPTAAPALASEKPASVKTKKAKTPSVKTNKEKEPSVKTNKEKTEVENDEGDMYALLG